MYELMPKGSLEGRLFGSGEDADTTGGMAGGQANADGGLSWRDRVRISWEIACALLFLHTAPTPIVHMWVSVGERVKEEADRTTARVAFAKYRYIVAHRFPAVVMIPEVVIALAAQLPPH